MSSCKINRNGWKMLEKTLFELSPYISIMRRLTLALRENFTTLRHHWISIFFKVFWGDVISIPNGTKWSGESEQFQTSFWAHPNVHVQYTCISPITSTSSIPKNMIVTVGYCGQQLRNVFTIFLYFQSDDFYIFKLIIIIILYLETVLLLNNASSLSCLCVQL